ncbi:MAG: hypothetical protein ABR530_06570 [Pyrinomonadaceae bacterium]
MPTQITQIDNVNENRTTLRVEGEMGEDDALLLERIGTEIRNATGNTVLIDLADLDVIDSDAAPILRRLGTTRGFQVHGIEIFLQTVINNAERGRR